MSGCRSNDFGQVGLEPLCIARRSATSIVETVRGLSKPAKRRPISPVTPGLSATLCALLAAAMTLAVIQYSFRHGRLVIFPTYDDVGYFADGAERLQALYDDGVNGLARKYMENPPHSPWQAAMAVMAFALFGLHDWAPYAMNAVVALGFFLLGNRLLGKATVWQRVAALVLLASIPFMPMAVHEFRPDHAAALFTAIGVLLPLAAPFVYGPRRRQVAIGFWLGMALLAKTTVFPQTVALGATAMILAVGVEWIGAGHRPRAMAVARAWLAVLLPILLIATPHYFYNRAHILHYIHEILFGKFKDSYQYGGSFAEQARYYLYGPGGLVMLGRHCTLLFGIVIGGAACALAWGSRRLRTRLFAWIALLFLAWLIPTLNKTKQPFFGLTFDALLAGVALLLVGNCLRIERLARHRLLHFASAALLIIMLMGVWRFQWPTREGDAMAGWEAQRRQIVDSLFDTIVAHCTFHQLDTRPLPDPRVAEADKNGSAHPLVLLCGTGSVNADLLRYMSIQRQVPLLPFFNEEGTTADDFIDYFDDADFIVCCDSGTLLMADFLPVSKLQDALLAQARRRPELSQIGQWSFMKAGGKSLYLFMRRPTSDFAGADNYTPLSGLGPVEGPFPEAHLRAVRWGMGPSTKLKFHADVPGMKELTWSARTDFQQQVVTVLLDGKQVAAQPIPGSFTDSYRASISFAVTSGDHELTLNYARWHEDGPRPMAVLFRALRLKSAP